MKLSNIASKVIHNKYVLYFVLFLSVTNILGYMVMGKITPMLFFAIVAYLVYNFSKNMIIVLGSALILTNILMIGNGIKEGLENSSGDGKDKNKKTDSKVKDDDIIHPPLDHTSQTSTTSSNSTVNENSLETKNDSPLDDKNELDSASIDKKDEGMINNKRKNRLDYASTIEDAYGDLNNILGGDGIKRLTEDTQKLMSQQLQLADAMKGMSPVMENAKSLLQGFDMNSINNLASLAKSFTSKDPQALGVGV